MTLFVTGDIMLGRGVKRALSQDNFSNLFEPIKKIIGANPIVANLECTLSNSNQEKLDFNKSPNFLADPKLVKELKSNNFIAFSLANNHIFDAGIEGYEDTKKNLNSLDIKSFGAGLNINEAFKASKIVVDETNISLIGASYRPLAKENIAGVADAYSKDLLTVIKNEKDLLNTDIVVVFIHTGIELLEYPLPRDQKLFKDLIDHGADLVVGGHSHCIQVKETYKNKLIYYSLGDLIFDHRNTEVWDNFNNTNTNVSLYVKDLDKDKPLYSLMLKIDFLDKKIKNIKEYLLKIPSNINRPFAVPVEENEKNNWYKFFNKKNYLFKEDKSINSYLKKIEKDLILKIKKGK